MAHLRLWQGPAPGNAGAGRAGNWFPAVYFRQRDYISMLPDGHLGNYCWLDVDDYQDLPYERTDYNEIRAQVGLVFWLDLRTAYPSDYENRTIEHAKNDVLVASAPPALPGLS